MKNVSPETLRAWVDGELSPARSAEISVLVAADPELAERAARFEASKLPYRAAMSQDIPPVPAELSAQVEQWSQIADHSSVNEQAHDSNHYRTAFFVTAAALMIAIVSWASTGFFKAADPVSDWTAAIVNYQNFYVADTVIHIGGDRQAAIERLASLKQQFPELPAMPPDLTAQGYDFKRIQRLDFDNKPVIQMVFYKPGRRPLAICLMPDDETVDASFAKHELLNSYVWQRDGLRAIVVAEEDATVLREIAGSV